jgi:hypothetical protein
MLAFAITMILENSINIAARRIYSSKCDYFVDAHIFTNRVGAFPYLRTFFSRWVPNLGLSRTPDQSDTILVLDNFQKCPTLKSVHVGI